ncbi:MAG: methyltransferase domain-containing protein [bacterium]
MSFDYEQSIWGQGTAKKRWTDSTSFRLHQALSALSHLKAGDMVLEIGCGAGQFIRAIKKYRSDLQYSGCDISTSALSRADQYRDGVQYDLSQAQSLPYEDNYFQAVLIFDVLEHVEDPRTMLAQAKRILKKDGILHCFVPCEADKLSLWYWLKKIKIKSDLTERYAGHIHKFSRQSLKDLLINHGFEIIQSRYSSHCLGQWLDLVVFLAMDRSCRRTRQDQMNNEQFFKEYDKDRGRIFFIFKRLINWLINLENWLFSRLPSSNVHITSMVLKENIK